MSPDDTPADGNRPLAFVTPAPDAPVAPNQSVPEMLQAIMARFIQQEETNKATSDRLAALAAALGTLDGCSRPQTLTLESNNQQTRQTLRTVRLHKRLTAQTL